MNGTKDSPILYDKTTRFNVCYDFFRFHGLIYGSRPSITKMNINQATSIAEFPVSSPLLTGIEQCDLDIERLVKSAAYVSECEIVVLLVGVGSKIQIANFIGGRRSEHRPDEHFAALIDKSSSSSILEDHLDSAIDSAAKPLLFIENAERLRYAATIKIVDRAGTRVAALILADNVARPGLSAAQKYVVLTHAVQIGRLLDRNRPDQNQVVVSQKLSERLRLLESVVVHANDAVLITEAEPVELPGPRIVYVNKAFEKTTGYSEAEVVGKTPRILQAEAISRGALDKLKAALLAWKPVEVELLNRRKDGSEFWVELSIVPVANEKGWFTHWVSVQRDVSFRKRSDEIATRARIAEAENLAFAAEIKERKRIEARLLHEAFHDDLTTLRNRAFFMDRLSVVLGLAELRADELNTVLFLDLDGFKLVNDSLAGC